MEKLYEGFFNEPKKVSDKVANITPQQKIGATANILEWWHVTEDASSDIIILFDMNNVHYVMYCEYSDPFDTRTFVVFSVDGNKMASCGKFQMECIAESTPIQFKLEEIIDLEGHTDEEFVNIYKSNIWSSLVRMKEELGYMGSGYYESQISIRNKDWDKPVVINGPFRFIGSDDIILLATEKKINDTFNSNIRL